MLTIQQWFKKIVCTNLQKASLTHSEVVVFQFLEVFYAPTTYYAV